MALDTKERQLRIANAIELKQPSKYFAKQGIGIAIMDRLAKAAYKYL